MCNFTFEPMISTSNCLSMLLVIPSTLIVIDLLYQDVSQPNQAQIAVANANYYLNDAGKLILAIKSQSIDSIVKSEEVYAQEKRILETSGYEIIESINIHKYAANHIVVIVSRSRSVRIGS